VMKVPHAVAIHAIRVLPALAWLLSFATLAERGRARLVAAATLGYAVLVAVSLLQTATGWRPWTSVWPRRSCTCWASACSGRRSWPPCWPCVTPAPPQPGRWAWARVAGAQGRLGPEAACGTARPLPQAETRAPRTGNGPPGDSQ
jgi:hypothetical protein